MFNKIVYTILGIGLALVFFPHAARDMTKKGVVSGASTQVAAADLPKAAPEMALSVQVPDLSAKSALAYDLDSGSILYSRNLDQKLPIASLTKLMTALVVVQHADLNAEVVISKSDLAVVGSTVGLLAGEKIKVSDLLSAMLIPSGNDAALALANFTAGTPEKFADLMNQEVADLKLVDTHFSNPVGWDSFDSQENFSNSLDLLKIVQEFLKHANLRQIAATKETSVASTDGKYVHRLGSTNKLLLSNSEVVGLKTGFTSKALGNLIILANHNDRQIVTIVLGSQNREDDSQKLMDWIFSAYQW